MRCFNRPSEARDRMAKKFRDLVAPMPEERQARRATETRRLIDEMPLQVLRKALELTQQQVAAALGITSGGVKHDGWPRTGAPGSALTRRAGNRSERRPLRASGLVLGFEGP